MDYFGKGLESVSVKCSIGGTSPVSLALIFYYNYTTLLKFFSVRYKCMEYEFLCPI